MKKLDNGLQPVYVSVQPNGPSKGTLANEPELLQLIHSSFIDKKTSHIICYCTHGIFFGELKGGNISWADDGPGREWAQKLLLARIFNVSKELKIWLEEEIFYYRLREDTALDENDDQINAVDALQILWGTHFEMLTCQLPALRLWEDRGTELVLPFTSLPDEASRDRVAIHTRSYITWLDNGQATFNDSRFVGLHIVKEPAAH